MEGYPPDLVAHNLPLLVVSGFEHVSTNEARPKSVGAQITSEVPPIDSEDAQILLALFKDSDGRNSAWNGREHADRNKFLVELIGRAYVLPARHAQPALENAFNIPRPPKSPGPKPVLHSPLSPLTPGSSVYPDGLLDPQWVHKHQHVVPGAYISFYNFTSDPNLATLHDNQLKTDINNCKGTFVKSGYRTRVAVALLAEKSILESPDYEDRLFNIRKATGLDPKCLFLLPAQSSPVELRAFVQTILTTLYPFCIDYYRDLTKHSRRKRNRGVVPPPTAPPTSRTSQNLSLSGWNVRYDFKLGVFAEFRQEMDVAIRSYESGYEGLLGQDVLETIAVWSPRWNEARLVADVFAIRILRCLLWCENYTAAVRRWQSHRERIRDVVDRRGKGSATYGWEAWEARWATVMAQMIKKVDIIDFSLPHPATFLQPERSILLGECVAPWEKLHHSGYWYRMASQHLIARRSLAMKIPEEDRSSPGSSPASAIASKAYTYDTFLCPEPHEENPLPGFDGVDHALLIVDCLDKAIAEFEPRGQSRHLQELLLNSGREQLKREAWDDAVSSLRQLWQKMCYREEGWWSVVEETGWALRTAAARAGDGGSVIAVDWELMNDCFTCHPHWRYDLSISLEGLDAVKTKPAVVLRADEVHSFLSANYTFDKAEGKVGEYCSSQLVVRSSAHRTSAPVKMTEILVEFEGSMKPILIRHRDCSEATANSSRVCHNRVALSDILAPQKGQTQSAQSGRATLVGHSDLTFPPGQTVVFEFSSLLREAGDAKVLTAQFSLATDLFDLDYIHKFERTTTPVLWWGERGRNRLVRVNAASILVLPKPPKMDMKLSNFYEQYYTNELIELDLEITNGEDVDCAASLDVRFSGEDTPNLTLTFSRGPDNSAEKSESESESENGSHNLALGRITAGTSTAVTLSISPVDLPAIYGFEMKISYNLISDLETPVSKSMTAQLSVISPFEANYDFSPRIHPDPWPSFFSHVDVTENAKSSGLAQKWCLTTRYASFALEDLIIEDLDVEVLGTNGGIQCTMQKAAALPDQGLRISPKIIEEAQFHAFTQKLSLDDRGSATLDVLLAIKWRRDIANSSVNTSILPVPRVLVSSSEPRVLAAASYSSIIPSMVHFDVTIENPSHHFLSFALNMEPSEQFAFSGMKQSTLQLVPLSRRTVKFRLLPNVRGEWIGPIKCVIRDRYFQKVLKIAPTDGMKADKEGLLVWIPPDEEHE